MSRYHSRPFLVLGLIGLLAAPAARALAAETPPNYPALSPEAVRLLDRTWERMQRREPDLAVRDVFNFLLTAGARGWRPEQLGPVIDLAESMHDLDPASSTYGNYRWYWRNPKPDDRNAVEFSMQAASLAWALYRDRLPEAARDKLRNALDLGVEGMLRHKVDVSYTNIFLMRLANCILIGEFTGRPDLVQRGRAWLDEWLAYTRACGIHEYSSPTYYGVDLSDLGGLARYAQDPTVRAQATRGLQYLWTDIAANWFAPFEGIAGAHSRDYGFLTGHGYLDQQLLRAHWIDRDPGGESRPVLDDLTFWAPPAGLREAVGPTPRMVSQQWGRNPWERATHYVGRHFSLGSVGAAYGAQDRILALTLAGGPQVPIASLSFDYRRDPYGRHKIATSGGHMKLTHLVPFVAAVQRGPEVVLLAAFDPHGKGKPAAPDGIGATFVLPSAAEIWEGDRLLPTTATDQSLPAAAPIFLRDGDVAAMIRFVLIRDDSGRPARLIRAHDGQACGAQRVTAQLAEGQPQGPVLAAVWVRAVEGLDDGSFAAFRRDGEAAGRQVSVRVEGERVDLSVPGLAAPLRLAVDLHTETRLAADGGDPSTQTGILNVNGRDLGASLLP